MKADDAKNIAPVDYLSRDRAREFLARTVQRMETEGAVREDITLGQQFQRWRWITGTGIKSCWVQRVEEAEEGGRFVVVREDRSAVSLTPCGRSTTIETVPSTWCAP